MAVRKTRMSVRGVAGLVQLASARGFDAALAWRTVRSGPEHLRDPDAYVDVSDVHTLWELIDDRLQDPSFPIQVAQAPRTSDQFGVFGFVMLTSPTAGEAFARTTRYLKLFSTALELSFEPAPGGARLTLTRTLEDRRGLRLANEFVLAEMVSSVRVFVGADVQPSAVHFTHPRPSNVTAHERHFRAPVQFGQLHDALFLDTRLLEKPMPRGDPGLLAYFEAQATAALERLDSTTREPVSDQVRRELAKRVGTSTSLPTIARALGFSDRTLRRRLADEGTRFERLQDATLEAIARRHLEQGALTISEIAWTLGYQDPSAFHRAFKRWTGQTPGEFRVSSASGKKPRS